jgi:hypothetical protein
MTFHVQTVTVNEPATLNLDVKMERHIIENKLSAVRGTKSGTTCLQLHSVFAFCHSRSESVLCKFSFSNCHTLSEHTSVRIQSPGWWQSKKINTQIRKPIIKIRCTCVRRGKSVWSSDREATYVHKGKQHGAVLPVVFPINGVNASTSGCRVVDRKKRAVRTKHVTVKCWRPQRLKTMWARQLIG